MSTPLTTALRESCEYLRDGGYRQTAQLLMLAADEIERLKREVEALEVASGALRRPLGTARRPARPSRPAVPSGGG